MKERIEIPTAGEILKYEFMEPLGMTSYSVAKAIGTPVSRIQDIVHGRRKITADTSLRLDRLFGMSDGYFLSLQADSDIRREREQIEDTLERIAPIAAA